MESVFLCLRNDHQQPVAGLRYQQVHQRRAVGPGERALALLHWPVPGGRHQRALLLVLRRGRLLRSVVPQRSGSGSGLAAVWPRAAKGTARRG